MLKRHPLPALLFVWALDLLAVGIIVISLRGVAGATAKDWLEFFIWTLILCISQLGGLRFAGLDVLAGWYAAVDFAAALVLPFPMFSLAILIRFGATVVNRIRTKHPEPFLGPDFNAANVTLNAGVAVLVHGALLGLYGPGQLAETIALLLTGTVFVGVQILLTTTLLSLDLRRPWLKVGQLDRDVLLSDGIMVIAGAIVSHIYRTNPYLMAFTVLLLLLLHKTLVLVNEAKLAYIDSKTGIYNYRYFDEMLTEHFRKSELTKRPLSVIFADMDHLRDINNTYGHLVGDKAIAAVGKAFRECGHPDGIACRFGGEEFVLLIPGCAKAQALEVAERVRQSIAKDSILDDAGKAIRITASFGVASFPEDVGTMEELVKAADEAVYEAKHSGRNRVCVYRKHKLAVLP